MEKKEIEKKAEDILNEYQPNTLQGVDVIEIAREMGFLVGNIDLDDNEDGFVIVNEDKKGIPGQPSKKIIGVNSNRSPKSKMFIIAHELGHYTFEKEKSDIIYSHRECAKGRTDYENDIDYFAACLLMPKDSFNKRYEALKTIYENDYESIIRELSDVFKVTVNAVTRRIEEIGIN